MSIIMQNHEWTAKEDEKNTISTSFVRTGERGGKSKGGIAREAALEMETKGEQS